MTNRVIASREPVPTQPAAAILWRRSVRRVGISVLFLMGILFAAAGDLHWAMAWVYLGLLLVGLTITTILIARTHPDLLAERSHIGEGVKAWDKPLAMLMGLAIPLSTLLVAGLDHRWRWSGGIPLQGRMAGVAIFIAGCVIVTWAMTSNRFFAPVVRIQEDRGHTVATAGPYGIVRHPGYVGMTLCGVGVPLMLGSLWGLLPAGLGVGVAVLRTALEDQTLQRELAGYSEYAARVRFRLIPGIW